MRKTGRQSALQLQSVAARYRQPKPWRGRDACPKFHFYLFRAEDDRQGTNDDDQRAQRLEAVLFLARDPLNSRKLSQFANLADGTEARTLVRQINERYDQAGRAIRVEEVAGGYQLMTRPKFAQWLRRLDHIPKEVRLSTPALETLAVVAYRQPVLRADTEAIRGVSCGEILRQLMERDLVRISGRSEDLGRPYLYSTTRLFLQTFGLKNLEELPRADAFGGESPYSSNGAQAALADEANGNVRDDQKEDSEVSTTIDPPSQKNEVNDEELEARPVSDSLADDDFDDDEDDDLDDEDDDEGDDDFDDDFDDGEWEEVEDEDEDEEDDWDDDEEEDWGEESDEKDDDDEDPD